jgi:clan AA aspartic protease (TIGR02281 family)
MSYGKAAALSVGAFAAGLMLGAVAMTSATRMHEGHDIVAHKGDADECLVDGFAEGAQFTFEVDTGAPGLFFGRNHARALGLNPDKIRFEWEYNSVSGSGREAAILLRRLDVGGLVLNDVQAFIGNTASVKWPLLGRSVLKRMNLTMAHGECALSG